MRMYITKKQEERRMNLLEIEHSMWDCYPVYDILYFKHLTPEVYHKLVHEGLIDPEDAQNNSPTFSNMNDFCEKHPGFTMHGYVVSPYRSDCRITCEGVEMENPNSEYMNDFYHMFYGADTCKFTIDVARSWYD